MQHLARLIVLPILLCPVATGASPKAKDLASLQRRVEAYVSAKRKTSRAAAYAKIAKHPLGSIDNVTAVLRSRVKYRPALAGMTKHALKSTSGKPLSTYTVIVPKDYHPKHKWPLILALAGGRGNGAKYAPFWQRTLQGEKYLVVCPVGRDAWWHSSYVIALAALKDACKRYNVDRNRVYVTGISNGGNGSWFLAMHYPDLFAAAAPMAGCPATKKGGMDFRYLGNLLNVPVYAVHGAADETISIEPERKAESVLRRLSYDFKFEEIPNGSHGSPSQRAPQIVKWFESQQRDPAPAHVCYRKQTSGPKLCYWMMIGRNPNKRPAALDARIVKRNRIELKTARVGQLVLFLNDDLVDADGPIEVYNNGKLAKTYEPKPGLKTLLLSAQLFDDPERLYPMSISLKLSD